MSLRVFQNNDQRITLEKANSLFLEETEIKKAIVFDRALPKYLSLGGCA